MNQMKQKRIMKQLFLLIIMISIIPNILWAVNVDSLGLVLKNNQLSHEERLLTIKQFQYDYIEGNTEEALAFVHLIRSYDNHKDELELVYLNLLEGMAYKRKGEYVKALSFLKKDSVYLKTLEDDYIQAEFAYQLGVTSSMIYDFENGLIYLNKALESYQKLDNDRGEGMTLNALGTLHRSTGQKEKAKEKYEAALEIYQKIDYKIGIADCYNNLANVHGSLGEFDEAEVYYKKQEKIDIEEGHEQGLGILYENMGTLYAMQKKYAEGFSYYEKSLIYHQKFNNKKNIANVQLMHGYTMALMGDYDNGMEMIEESIKTAEEADLKVLLPRTYAALSELSENKGEYKKSLKYYQLFKDANDDYLSEKTQKEIAALDAKFETEKKEKAILALNSENEIKDLNLAKASSRNFWMSIGLISALCMAGIIFYYLRQRQKTNQLLEEKNEIISKALEEKNILLKEIHHRVKNNLQVISSLLNLQSKHIDDSKAVEAINEGRNRVHSMALIHQSLYQKDNLIGIEVKTYFEKLIHELFHTYKVDHDQIKLKINIDPIQLDVDTMVPLGLIMNELVTNTLKYAFVGRDEGELNITLKESNNELVLKVEDDGVGINNENLSENPTTFGYQLIDAFIHKMEGTIDVKSDNGTSVILKINNYKLAA